MELPRAERAVTANCCVLFFKIGSKWVHLQRVSGQSLFGTNACYTVGSYMHYIKAILNICSNILLIMIHSLPSRCAFVFALSLLLFLSLCCSILRHLRLDDPSGSSNAARLTEPSIVVGEIVLCVAAVAVAAFGRDFR